MGRSPRTAGGEAAAGEGARAPRRLLAWAVLQGLFSAAAIAWIARSYEQGGRVALLHLGLVAALWLACVAALVAGSRLARLRPLAGALPFALFALLFVVYAANAVALAHWGHTVSLGLLRQFLGNLPNLAALLPLRAAVLAAALAALAWLCARSARPLHEELTRRFAERAPRWVAVFGLGAVLVGGLSADRLLRAPALWNREPLLSLLDLRAASAAVLAPGAPPDGLAEVSRDPPRRRAHVVLVVVDALRASSMGVYGYARPTTPFLSRLHGTGELARVGLGVSACSQSECGVLSLLGSQSAGRWRPGALKLHDVLHLLGYRTVFVLSGSHLRWPGLAGLFGPNVDVVRDDPTNDDANLVRALHSLPDAERPTFLYLHLMSTHWFGVQRPEHQRYRPTAKRFDWLFDVKRVLGRGISVALRQQVVNRYDNSVLQADVYLERIFEVLAAKGYLDDALVVVTADHGEALGEHGESHYGHGADLYQELIGIPILFHDSRGADGFGALDFAGQDDVAPTLLDRLGVPVPASWDGRSLLSAEPRRRSFHESEIPGSRSRSGRDERVRAVIERRPDGSFEKLLRFEERDGQSYRVVRRESYGLRADDPTQRERPLDASSERLAELESRLDAHFETEAPPSARAAPR